MVVDQLDEAGFEIDLLRSLGQHPTCLIHLRLGCQSEEKKEKISSKKRKPDDFTYFIEADTVNTAGNID